MEHAVDAVAGLRHRFPGLTLDVVGEGWWSARLRRYAAARGVADAVRFHGWVDEATKHAVYAQAWVHVLPSVKEGWGLVVMEAGVHGTPTVAYRAAGGVAESVVHERTGLLADDSAGFVAAVGRLLGDDGLRARQGAAARQRARTFSWDATVDALRALVDEVTGAPDDQSSVNVRAAA
jgi:glycosyltransferase involved in cell wall biosynthesis